MLLGQVKNVCMLYIEKRRKICYNWSRISDMTPEGVRKKVTLKLIKELLWQLKFQNL